MNKYIELLKQESLNVRLYSDLSYVISDCAFYSPSDCSKRIASACCVLSRLLDDHEQVIDKALEGLTTNDG